MCELTEIEQKLLTLLAEHGEIKGSANLGFLLWPESERNNRTPQGMALAAGRVARRLKDKRIITACGQPALYTLCRN